MNHSRPLRAAPQVTAAPDPQRLNAVILPLYQAAHGDDLETFQDRAIAAIGGVVPFDASWWGCGVGGSGRYQVHGSHLHNLPDDVPRLHNSARPENPLARASAEKPGQALMFRGAALNAEPAIAALAKRLRARQVLCITQADQPLLGTLNFLVLTRTGAGPDFNEAERRWLELLNPHLNAALDLCCAAQMARWRRLHSRGLVLATSDARGLLHLSEPGLAELLRREWPNAACDRLPEPLTCCLANGRESFDGKNIHVGFLWLGQRILVSVRCRQPLDRLTPQERRVARAFAAGRSYKMVACEAGIAPATVRHHLRAAYAKLGISDKAALAQLVFAADASDDILPASPSPAGVAAGPAGVAAGPAGVAAGRQQRG